MNNYTLTKVFDSTYLQMYKDNISKLSKKDTKYEYVYVYMNSKDTSVKILESDNFPFNILNITAGFMFIHGESTDVPIIDDTKNKVYKTCEKCMSNAFINSDYSIIINAVPGENCNPNVINSFMCGYKSTKDISKNDLLKEFSKVQVNFKNVKEWKDYIYKECPWNIHFTKTIKDSTFKDKITHDDMYIEYDIHSEDEIKIIYEIEHIFEDLNQIVRVYDNYNNIVKRITEKCDELNIKYKRSDELKYKKLKYKGKDKTLSNDGLLWIELKYSDLEKCKLKYMLTDYIS